MNKTRITAPIAALAAVVCLLGCSSDDSGLGCSGPGADCTLGAAGAEVGLLIGTTSERLGWTEEREGELVRTHFSSVTSQNELKWGPLSDAPGFYDFAHADETVNFAEANGLRMRGHVLFWHRFNAIPPWVREDVLAASDPEARLRDLMREHVHRVMGRYRGRIHTWDVVNEPLGLFAGTIDPESFFNQVFERYDDFLDHAFRTAREADPEAKLFINEVLVETHGPTFDALYDLVRGMVERGTPIDGVGFQGHFIVGLPDRETLVERMQAFADLGLLVEITELDVSIGLLGEEPDPLAAQADAYRDVFASCVAVDACVGVTTWNSHDGVTWLDRDAMFGALGPHRPTLFDDELRPKPAYYAARDVLLGNP